MHIGFNPLALDKDGIDKAIVEKELEIIKAIENSGKPWMLQIKFLKENFKVFK